jgi:predicted RNase H-like HicB family nuclease
MRNLRLTAIIEREDDGYVALCPEIDVASQGQTVDEARSNLREAIQLFFAAASESEVCQRLSDDVRVETLEVEVT